MAADPSQIHGRGSAGNPANRFELLHYERDPEADSEGPAPATQFFRDSSRTIIARNDSPDVGFDASINPYRGCEHGCTYCYARPTHEYLGFSAGLDFETKIMVKEDAPELLRRELAAPRYQPQPLALSGVTDPYQPIERRLGLTRRCLEVLVEFRNPVVIVTNSHLVTRDCDLLMELARFHAVSVFVSVTTLDAELARAMEPRATSPAGRLAAIEELGRAGVPVGVLIAPVIPGLTDHELPAIIKAVAAAGAGSAGYVLLRLPLAVAGLFEQWLDRHRPASRDKVLGRIRAMRDGRLNDARFGSRMRGDGVMAEQIHALFDVACRQAGLNERRLELSTAAFRRPPSEQRLLFD
jgi:DNA repair photolyase